MLRRPVETGEYTAEVFARACRKLGVIQSMGRVGSALDNAAAEAFNSIIKVEYIPRRALDDLLLDVQRDLLGFLAAVDAWTARIGLEERGGALVEAVDRNFAITASLDLSAD